MINLKKLIATPKKFFLDSLWFKKDNIEIDTTADNLFVISHLGQLSQVEALIEYENLIDNFLVIVYASTNIKMPQLVKEKYNRQLFKGAYLLLLPDLPNDLKAKKLFFMRRNYRQVFDAINPKSIYFLSFEGHYNLLIHYAKKSQCKVCLIEDGTATYKKELTYESSISLAKKVKNIGLKSTYLIVKIFLFFKQIRKFKSEVKRHKHFDKLYVSFPELVKEKFEAKEVERFFLHAGEVKNREHIEMIIEKYKMKSSDFIYVNQRYPIENVEFAKAIVEILDEVAKDFESKVFIKMHPKDTISLKQEFLKQIQKFSLENKIIFIEESDFLIEPTVAVLKPRAVLGLTSTALVYVPLVSVQTAVYSIALKFLNQISLKSYNRNGIKIIKEHLDILRDFKHVYIVNKNESILSLEEKSIKDKLDTKEYLDKEEVFKAIKLALLKKQYKKVYFFLEKLYPKGIESMDLKSKEMYDKAKDIEKNVLEERQIEFIKSIQIQESFSNFKEINEMISSLEYDYILKMPISILNFYIKSLEIQNQKEKLYLFLKKLSISILENDFDVDKKNQLTLVIVRELLKFGYLHDASSFYNQLSSKKNNINSEVLKKCQVFFLKYTMKYNEIIEKLGTLNSFINDKELTIIYLQSLYKLKRREEIQEVIQISQNKVQYLAQIYLDLLEKDIVDGISYLEEKVNFFDSHEQIDFGLETLLINLYLDNLMLDKVKEKFYNADNRNDIENIINLVRFESLMNQWKSVELLVESIHQESFLNIPIETLELYVLALINLQKKYKLVQVFEILLSNNHFTIKIVSQYIELLIELGDITLSKEIINTYIDEEHQRFFLKKVE